MYQCSYTVPNKMYWQMKVSILFIIRCQSTWITTTNMVLVHDTMQVYMHWLKDRQISIYSSHNCKLNEWYSCSFAVSEQITCTVLISIPCHALWEILLHFQTITGSS